MRYFLSLVALIAIFAFYMPHFTKYMEKRPLYAKLGYVPHGKLFKAILGRFRWFEGEYYTFRAITYYGSKVKYIVKHNTKSVEYYNLYTYIKTAVLLNPYNEDAYYFAQAAFSWDVGQVRAVNSILKYVYKYRPWDFQIPFFLGFNYAYFLHDYIKAAKYFKDAAKLSGSSLFANLAARYFYEGGRTQLGIAYLKFLIKNTRNKAYKKIYLTRLKALEALNYLQKGVDKYKKIYGKLPKSIDELLRRGIISYIPEDPYGGKFYIDKNGKVKTTSKLARGWKK